MCKICQVLNTGTVSYTHLDVYKRQYIMCKGMNRSFISVILGGFGAADGAVAAGGAKEARPVKQGSADDAAFIMKNAEKVIIVPGYGMAVAQAQHALKEMADKLKAEGVEVSYACLLYTSRCV